MCKSISIKRNIILIINRLINSYKIESCNSDTTLVVPPVDDSRLKPIRACALMWGISRTGI